MYMYAFEKSHFVKEVEGRLLQPQSRLFYPIIDVQVT